MARSPDHLIGALDSLEKSEGWALVKKQMEDELDTVIRQLSSTPTLADADLHWRRGVVFAATQFLALPERLKNKIKNDVIIAKSITSPATAGQKGKTTNG